MPISAPLYREEDLRRAADEFLATYHPQRSIPVPIEHIIEYDFKMDVVPMPGLRVGFEIDAYLTCDLSEIRVDQSVWESRQNRYRFSLAHELAHRILHADIFRQLSFSTVGEWRAARGQIAEREYRFIEWHANAFAGFVLVPPDKLVEQFKIGEQNLKSVGISINDAGPPAWDWLVGWLADQFGVSQQVIERRGPSDGLWQR